MLEKHDMRFIGNLQNNFESYVTTRRKKFTIYDLISEDQHYFEEMNTT